jgi:hypothetical protein
MTPLKNPLPADFREHLHKTVPEQMDMYGVGRHTIMRWRRLSGVSVHQRAWTDEALATLKELVESGYSYDAIAKRMGLGRKRVCNAVERYRLAKGVSQPRATVRPVPDDFVEMWTDNPNSFLVKHYGASTKTIRRWVVEKRLKRPQKGANVRAVDFQRQPAEKPRNYVKDRYKTASVDYAVRDTSPAGEAQSYLQKEGYRPVVRCNADGVPTQGGAFWICGRSKGLSDDELIRRAYEIRERRVRMMGRAA